MTDFQAEVRKVDKAHKCVQAVKGEWKLPLGDVFFGVPESEFFGWRKFDKIASDTTGFNFYLGAGRVGLLAAFANSEFAHTVQRLSIGNSSFDLGTGMGFDEITSVLSETTFPDLRKFELGVWQLYSNTHCFYEKIGNVTKLLQNMPNIEHIGLFGAFQLDTLLSLSKLKYLSLKLDDATTCENGGFVSQKTLDNILSSSLPELRQFKIDLDCKRNDQEFTFTEKFTSGKNLPRIEKIVITGGYKNGEIDRLINSALGRRKGVDMQYIPRKF